MKEHSASIEQNPFDWEDSETRLWVGAYLGLLDGDPMPLAVYLRAGLPVTPDLSYMIASAIDGVEDKLSLTTTPKFRLIMKGKPGQRKSSMVRKSHLEKLRIGLYLNRRLSVLGEHAFEAAVKDTMEDFTKSRTVVTDAFRYLRYCFSEGVGDILGDLDYLSSTSPEQ